MQPQFNVPVNLMTPSPAVLCMGADSSARVLSESGESYSFSQQDGQTALVVDDSLTERTNLGRILQEAGYEVINASSGNEAVELAAKYTPDIIFLDILMDDGDGFKACRKLRRSESTTDTPIIMVSSKSNPVDIKWAEKLGANAYVVKPYDDEAILGKIRSL